MSNDVLTAIEEIELLASEIFYHQREAHAARDLEVWRMHTSFQFDKTLALLQEHWRIQRWRVT